MDSPPHPLDCMPPPPVLLRGQHCPFEKDKFPFIYTKVVYRLVISSDIHGERGGTVT